MASSQKLLVGLSRILSVPLFAGSVVAGLLLLATGLVSFWVYTVRLHDEVQQTTNVASDARDRLKTAVIHGLSAAQTIALCVEQGILPREFATVAPKIAHAYNSIDAVELTLGGVVAYVYPYAENKKAIGFNILGDSLQRDEALLAIKNRSLIFAGPLELVQGGLAVVGRGPVFLKKGAEEKFWGFTIVIMRVPTLIKYARLGELASTGYAYRLSKRNAQTGTEIPFVNMSIRLDNPVAVQVAVPNGQWLLEVAPAHGWKAKEKTVPTVLLSLLLSALGGAFVWYMARQPRLLKMLVEKRAAELLESERRFTALIEAAPVAITIMRDGKILYGNPALRQLLLIPSDQRIDRHDMAEFIAQQGGDETRDRVTVPGSHMFAHPEAEMVFERRDKVQIHVAVTVSTMSLPDGQVQVAFMTDITGRKLAEQRINNSLKEKELLLKEIHHRVKNNLQVISSLLGMQSQQVTDGQAREAYADSIRRIRSMALVHENLYRSNDLAQIDFHEYLNSVAKEIRRSLNRDNISLDVDAERILLGIDIAVPCGLIANELVSNALKHAFAHRAQGRVVVGFRRANQATIELEVRDDGVGFPRGSDYRTMTSMGMSIVRTLTEQISGILRMDESAGTRFTVIFPG